MRLPGPTHASWRGCPNGKRREAKLQPKKKALEIAGFAIGKHAKDVVILNVKKLSTVADYLVICSADSERQVAAIADAIEDGMRKKNARPMGVEGAKAGRWALMDFNDVVAHIFHEPVRRFYDLDGLWADAPRIEAEDRPKQGLPGSL